MNKKLLIPFFTFNLVMFFFCCCSNSSNQAEQERLDSIRIADSLAQVQRLADSIRVADSIANIPEQIKRMLTEAYDSANKGQKEAVEKYGTQDFIKNSAKSLSFDINMFGPSMYDFCSDESTKPGVFEASNVDIKEVNESTATAEVTVDYLIWTMDYEFDQYRQTDTCTDVYIVVLENVDGTWKISDIKYKSTGKSLTKRWATLA